MSNPRPERADAVRNRRAILAATEEFLSAHRPRDISIEQVALAAGVGKGTVFHRFGRAKPKRGSIAQTASLEAAKSAFDPHGLPAISAKETESCPHSPERVWCR